MEPTAQDISAPTQFREIDVDEVLAQQKGALSGFDQRTNTFVTFEMGEVFNKEKSDALGYPWYDNMELCRILYPDSKDIWLQPVRDIDIKNYPEQYKKFKEGLRGVDFANATPLTEWAEINHNKQRVEELAEKGIKCVEQIAHCADNAMYKIGVDANDLKKKAKAFLDHKNGVETIDGLKAKNKALEEKLSGMSSMMEEILSRLDAKEKGKK